MPQLTSLESYPQSPDDVGILYSLEHSGGVGDSYGAMVQGFIEAPQSGEYRLFVSGDDEVQFWLSDSDSPGGAVLTATVPSWTYVDEFDKYSSQTSAVKMLEGGQKYYFQIVYKNGFRGDHFAVAWEGPGFSRRIVDGSVLHSWATPSYSADGDAAEAYSLGYRVGYLDGAESLRFNPSYPPLDADQDGLYDNWEVVHNLDPANTSDATSDTDDDFLTARDEFFLGTSPVLPDTDGDGIPDGFEFAYGLDPLDIADASEDLDGDGATNLDEYGANTDITDPSDTPDAAIEFYPGFTGQYYEGTSFNQFIQHRMDESINFDWRQGAPMEGMPVNGFSIRWTGFFIAPHSTGDRDYQFSIRTDDGVRLILDNETVIDQWAPRGPTTNVATKALAAGEEIPITIEYYEGARGAVAQFMVMDMTSGQTIPQTQTVRTPDPFTDARQDTDGDGIPDTWELRHGSNMLRPNSDQIFNESSVPLGEAYAVRLNPWTLEAATTIAPSSTPAQPVVTQPTPAPVSATLAWYGPTQRTDGSDFEITDPSDYAYEIVYGPSKSAMDTTATVDLKDDHNTNMEYEHEIPLEPGEWFFKVRIIGSGQPSAYSNIMSLVVN